MDKIRKALVAGLGAGLSAGMAVIVEAWSGGVTGETITAAVGAALSAAVIVGVATWRVPNAPAPLPYRGAPGK